MGCEFLGVESSRVGGMVLRVDGVGRKIGRE